MVMATDAGTAGAGLFVGAFAILWLLIMALAIAGTVVWIIFLVEVCQIPEGWFRSGSKTTWVLLVALLGWIGVLIYMTTARPPAEVRQYLKQYRGSPYGPPPAFGYP